MRTFAVNVRFAVTEAVLLQFEPTADSCEKVDECPVFSLPCVYVFGKTPKERPRQQEYFARQNNPIAEEQIDDRKDQNQPYRDTVERVAPVPLHPKAIPTLSKSHFIQLLFSVVSKGDGHRKAIHSVRRIRSNQN